MKNSSFGGTTKTATANCLQSIDPASDELLANYPEHSEEAIIRTLEAAAVAQRAWRENVPAASVALRRASAILRRDKEQHAVLMAREMGKPADQARAELEKCALCCD